MEPLTIEQLTPRMIQEEVEIQDVVCENHLQRLNSYSEKELKKLILLYQPSTDTTDTKDTKDSKKKRKKPTPGEKDLWLLTYSYIPGYYNRSGAWEPSRGVSQHLT